VGLVGALFGAAAAAGLIFWALRPATRRSAAPSPAPVPPAPPAQQPTAPAPVPAPVPPSSTDTVLPPPLEQWRAYLAPGAAAHGIQLPYGLKWIDMESGGNPCAIGYPAAKGPDGNPKEMGIAQLYNPDDLQRFGATGAELRAYCVPGDQHDVVYKGKTIKGFSQALARPLTAAEMQRQADLAVDLMSSSMIAATHDLTSIQASSAWSPSTRNYWALVKLQHGLPALSREGLPRVAAFLKRPPSSFKEFRTLIENGSVKLDDETEKEYRADYARVFDNAEECASAFTEPSVA